MVTLPLQGAEEYDVCFYRKVSEAQRISVPAASALWKHSVWSKLTFSLFYSQKRQASATDTELSDSHLRLGGANSCSQFVLLSLCCLHKELRLSS